MRKFIAAAAVISVPIVAVIAAFNGERYDIACMLCAILCCLPFFFSFEKRAPKAGELMAVCVMTAFSAIGRLIFAPIPFFKPSAAVAVLTGMYFGSQSGFMCGAVSALISNIYFGQGAWTPFQMFGWGIIGFAAGVLNKNGRLEKTAALCAYGVIAGVAYSFIMDIWTVLSADGSFNFSRWLYFTLSAVPVTIIYCVSDVVFLLLLRKPLGKQLNRLKEKYGLFNS